MTKYGSSLFKKELNLIKDTEYRHLIMDILDNYVHYDNFIKPSSSTGKHHPYFDNEENGNVNHTKAVVKLCHELLTSRTDLNSDIIYASAILHDMWKYDGTSNHTLKNHAELGREAIFKYIGINLNELSLKGETFLGHVANLIGLHMGHWDNENWFEDINKDNVRTDELLILHYSDMIASRKFYNVTDYKL